MWVKILYSFLVVLTLCGCGNNQQTDNNEYNLLNLDAIGSTFTMEMRYGNALITDCIEVNDVEQAIEVNFQSTGKDRQVSLMLFYDYQQIPFQIDMNEEAVKEYVFDSMDGVTQKMRIFLPKEIITADNNLHKLMISFVASSDIHASSLDDASDDCYGIHQVIDLKFSDSESSDLFVAQPLLTSPQNFFDINTLNVILNMDYDNEFLEKRLIALPEKELTVKAGETIELMYNLSNQLDYSDALLITAVGYLQTNMDGEAYKWIDLENQKTSNGKITITAPSNPGEYEVISYVIYEPFSKITDIDKTSVYTSPRFTLNVIE